jgi:hypothetical protein
MGSANAADGVLAELRGRRHRLAATVKSALLDLERQPVTTFPAARQAQAEHERLMLQAALEALLTAAPEVQSTDRAERELVAQLQELAA